jgi:hypothetical protein
MMHRVMGFGPHPLLCDKPADLCQERGPWHSSYDEAHNACLMTKLTMRVL